jgi:dTMP kinase
VKKGKLIVIDGIDGSGKATQTAMLAKRLKAEGVRCHTFDFPHYDGNFFGTFIGEYLSGKYGDFIQVAPRLASVLYAADRFESSGKIRNWLESGQTVIIDRYASANMIHQGGKIEDKKERKEFLKWLEKMEFGVFKIPRPDLVIYLDVPFEVSKSWLEKKVAQRKKKYLKGRKDVAEDNLLHLKASRESALMLEKENKNWVRIECCKEEICLPPEGVHEEVFKVVRRRLGLK